MYFKELKSFAKESKSKKKNSFNYALIGENTLPRYYIEITKDGTSYIAEYVYDNDNKSFEARRVFNDESNCYDDLKFIFKSNKIIKFSTIGLNNFIEKCYSKYEITCYSLLETKLDFTFSEISEILL